MANAVELPYVEDVVRCLVNAQFQDSMRVINTAQNIHDCLLVPCPLLPDSPFFTFYPPLREISLARPLTIQPEVDAYLAQLASSGTTTIFTEDVLFPARARLIEAYRQALIQRTKRMPKDLTRIDVSFPTMTPAEHQERVAYVLERAITIPISQVVDWWADVVCGVAQTAPSAEVLAARALEYPDASTSQPQINGWREIGYIIELLER